LGAIGRPLGFQPLSADMNFSLPIPLQPPRSSGAPRLVVARARNTAIETLSGPGSASVAFTTEGR